MTDTIPHLVYPAEVIASIAAASVVRAASFLSANGHSVAGTFSLMGWDGRIRFYANDAHARLIGLSLGQSVRVDCTLRGESLVFFSQICRIGAAGRWEIERPTTVHRRNLRNHVRIDTTTDDGVVLLVMSAQGMVSCAVQNLSEGGCAVACSDLELFKEGRVFQAWLAQPGVEPIGVYARCRWSSELADFGVAGLQFFQVSSEVQNRLAALIMSRVESPHEGR